MGFVGTFDHVPSKVNLDFRKCSLIKVFAHKLNSQIFTMYVVHLIFCIWAPHNKKLSKMVRLCAIIHSDKSRNCFKEPKGAILQNRNNELEPISANMAQWDVILYIYVLCHASHNRYVYGGPMCMAVFNSHGEF